MRLVSSLSKETSNSYSDIIKMPAHILIGIYNTLTQIFEEEREAQKEEIDKMKSSSHTNLPNYGMGNFNPQDFMSNNIPKFF